MASADHYPFLHLPPPAFDLSQPYTFLSYLWEHYKCEGVNRFNDVDGNTVRQQWACAAAPSAVWLRPRLRGPYLHETGFHWLPPRAVITAQSYFFHYSINNVVTLIEKRWLDENELAFFWDVQKLHPTPSQAWSEIYFPFYSFHVNNFFIVFFKKKRQKGKKWHATQTVQKTGEVVFSLSEQKKKWNANDGLNVATLWVHLCFTRTLPPSSQAVSCAWPSWAGGKWAVWRK